MKRIPTWLLVAGFGVAAGSSESAASGFMVRENSAASVATAFAGNASRAEEVATVFNNPAGMSFLAGTQTQIGATGVFPSINFEGEATTPFGPIPADNSRNNGQFAAVPHAYAVLDLHERLKAGLAITVPFGNTIDYSEDWSGRYINIKTAASSLDINPNLSYRLTDRIAIAGGVSLQYLSLDLSSKIPQFLIFGPGTPDGGFLLEVDNWGWGYNFGILAEPWDGTRIGASYRSGIDHGMTGTLTFDPTTSPLLGLVDGPAQSDISVPASITASLTQQVTSSFSLSADVQFTAWHTFKVVEVNSANPPFEFHQHYRDTWMFSVGGVYRLNPVWTLRAGFGFDESPVVDGYRDAGVPDKDRYMLGVGFGYQIAPSVSLDLGYAHYFAAGRATMNESINRVEPITGAVILNGYYDNHMDYLTISLRTAL